MKKKVSIFLICISAILFFTLTVNAEKNDFETEIIEVGGINDLEDSLSDQSKELLESFNIKPNTDILNNLNSKNLLEGILDIALNCGKTPLKVGVTVVVILILSSLLKTVSLNTNGQAVFDYTVLALIIAMLAIPSASTIDLTIRAIKDISIFSIGFIPALCGILISSGNITSVGSTSATLLGVAELIMQLCGGIIAPLVSMYMAVSICASLSGSIKFESVTNAIKSGTVWVLSLISTIFLGVINLQSVLGKATDTLSLKTAKFIIGSSVPIAGGVISESLLTVKNSLSLIGTSVGIYGIFVMILVLLPVLFEIIIWRVVVKCLSALSEILSVNGHKNVFAAIDSAFAIILAILIFVGVIFIISTSILSGVK